MAARGKVTVCEARDGQVSIEYRGRTVPRREAARRALERRALASTHAAKRASLALSSASP